MNYKKHYYLLIERARFRVLDSYTESHHIVPRCLGGTDNQDNLVNLTPEEHYLAHQLLVKIYPNNPKLIYAAAMMIPSRPNNKLYGWIKRRLSETVSKMQAGKGNSQFGTKWIFNDALKVSKKVSKEEPIPEGWSIGRKINFTVTLCKTCSSKIETGIYCSKKCKTYFLYPSLKIIDDNLEDMINDFKQTKSITETLKRYGIEGRSGNSYFSKILKSKNIPVLRRRNTKLL